MSNLIENITFLHCPEDRRVKVRIPVLVSAHVPPTCAADACMLTMLKSRQPCLGKSADEEHRKAHLLPASCTSIYEYIPSIHSI